MSFPAFKEWQVIVEALGSGEQVLILRKGGLAEGRDGFQLKEKRFWLFPTSFHAQTTKTKPAAQKWFAPLPEEPTSNAQMTKNQVMLHYFADVFAYRFIGDEEAVASLDDFHFWSATTIRERFAWSTPPGLHAFVVRVHKLVSPIALAVTPQMAGCKSWIDLPYDFKTHASKPVIDAESFGKHPMAREVMADPQWVVVDGGRDNSNTASSA